MEGMDEDEAGKIDRHRHKKVVKTNRNNKSRGNIFFL